MRRLVCAIAATLIGLAPATALDLAPTGTLRATFIGGNAVQAVTDPKTGETHGPAADIVRELARRAGRGRGRADARDPQRRRRDFVRALRAHARDP